MSEKNRNTLSFDLRAKTSPDENKSEEANVISTKEEGASKIESYESNVINLVEGFLESDKEDVPPQQKHVPSSTSATNSESEKVEKSPKKTNNPPQRPHVNPKKSDQREAKPSNPSHGGLYGFLAAISTTVVLSGAAIGYVALNGVPDVVKNYFVEQVIHEQKTLMEDKLGVIKNEFSTLQSSQSKLNEDFKTRIEAAEKGVANAIDQTDNVNTKSQMAINSLTPKINSNTDQITSIKQRELDIIQQVVEGDDKIEVNTKQIKEIGEKIHSIESNVSNHDQYGGEIERLKNQLSKMAVSSTKIKSIEGKVDLIQSDLEKIAQANKRKADEQKSKKKSDSSKNSSDKEVGNITYRIIYSSADKALIRVKTPTSKFNKAYYIGDDFEGKGVIKGFANKEIILK